MRKKISFKIFWTITFFLISLTSIFYIFQVTSLIQSRYLLKNYEKKLKQLTKESEMLEINLSKSNSFSKIENYLTKENFVKTNKIKYIQILGSTVAAK